MESPVDEMIGQLLMGEELEEEPSGFPNLMELNGPDRDRLEDQLKATSGKLRVVVHPFFLQIKPDEGTQLDLVREGWMKMMASQSENSLPVVFFAQGGYEYEYLENLWKTYADKKQLEKIYFVPTHNADPYPISGYKGEPAVADSWDPYNKRDRNWNKLIGVLESVGVEECLVGGEFLKMEDSPNSLMADQGNLRRQMEDKIPDDGKTRYWNECVGEVAGRLAKRFKIDFSNLAFPHRRVHAYGLKEPEEVNPTMWETKKPEK